MRLVGEEGVACEESIQGRKGKQHIPLELMCSYFQPGNCESLLLLHSKSCLLHVVQAFTGSAVLEDGL